MRTSSRPTWSGRSSSSAPHCPTSAPKAAARHPDFVLWGQVAFAGNSLYHTTKWGIEGFVESVAQEVAPFGIGMTIVEPGGARTEFRFGSAQVAQLMPVYDQTPARSFLRMLDPQNGLVPGDPARMAARIIESVDVDPAPLRLVLGSQALEGTLTTLRKRIEGFEAQTELAASTDFPSEE